MPLARPGKSSAHPAGLPWCWTILCGGDTFESFFTHDTHDVVSLIPSMRQDMVNNLGEFYASSWIMGNAGLFWKRGK